MYSINVIHCLYLIIILKNKNTDDMKKLLQLLLCTSCAVSASAADIKFGFTSEIDGTNVEAPHLVAWNDGDNDLSNDVSFEIARGNQSTGSGKGSMYWGSTTALTFKGTCERSQYGGNVTSAENAAVWTGAKITVPSGYKLDVTSLQLDIAGQDFDWYYKVVVYNGDGTAMFTQSSHGKPKQASKLQVTSSSTYSLTGAAYVKVFYWFSGTSTSKYFAVPELYVTGSLSENVQTNYTKPTLTRGNYNQANGTYAVTLTVADGENGTISYTIGSGAEVTGVASGTVISVAPNTTVTAKVTGSTYGDSDNATLTTADQPQLSAPTYSITDYNFSKNVYTLNLSAASGATVYYSADRTNYSEYNGEISVVPGSQLTAYSAQANMRQSENTVITVEDAPVGGTFTTPQIDGTYTDGMVYNAGAYTINNTVAYICGQVSSGNSSINKSIKMRIGRQAGNRTGVRLNVNSGYVINSVSVQILNNYDTKIECKGVYVDGSDDNELTAAVALPYASNGTSPALIEASGFEAASTIDFEFGAAEGSTDTPNQAQVVITVSYSVVGTGTLGTSDNNEYGFATLSAPHNYEVSGADAYKASLVSGNIVLSPVSGVIPANDGVIVAGAKGAQFTISYVSDDATADMSGNQLCGTSVRTLTSTLAGGSVLMAFNAPEAEFWEYTGEYFPANKAYYLTSAAVGAKSIKVVFADDEEATAVSSVNADAESAVNVRKIFKDGMILLETTDGTYTLAGARVK